MGHEFAVHLSTVRGMQNAIQGTGQWLTYYPASTPGQSLQVRGRVRYLTALELANCLEQYALEVTLDPRDFPTTPPMKGDSILIDGGRRGVMQVREAHGSDHLVSYRCGVQG